MLGVLVLDISQLQQRFPLVTVGGFGQSPIQQGRIAFGIQITKETSWIVGHAPSLSGNRLDTRAARLLDLPTHPDPSVFPASAADGSSSW